MPGHANNCEDNEELTWAGFGANMARTGQVKLRTGNVGLVCTESSTNVEISVRAKLFVVNVVSVCA